MRKKSKFIFAISYWLSAISCLSGCLTLDSSTKPDEAAQMRSSISEEIIKIKDEVNSLKGQIDELQYKIDKLQQAQSQQSNEMNTTLREWQKEIQTRQAQDKKELENTIKIITEEVTKENKELRNQIEAIRKASGYSAQEGYYVVAQGDTLSKIAQMFGVSVKDIMEANNITDPNSIRVGQRLIIPQKRM